MADKYTALGNAIFKYVDQLVEAGKIGFVYKADGTVEIIPHGPVANTAVNEVKKQVAAALTALKAEAVLVGHPPVTAQDEKKPEKTEKPAKVKKAAK